MKYIKHYTDNGDIILDGFSGSGMTGYAVKELNGMDNEGFRYCILNDLSPAASLISYNYSANINKDAFYNSALNILEKLKGEFESYYMTRHKTDSGESVKVKVNYIVWTDVFLCSNCQSEINFWKYAVDKENKRVKDNFTCEECGTGLKRRGLEFAEDIYYDKLLNKTVKVIKQVPAMINYTYLNKRYEKAPDENDLQLLYKVSEQLEKVNYKTQRMPVGSESRRNDKIGYTHSHHYYTERTLIILSKFMDLIKDTKYFTQYLFFFQAGINLLAKTSRYRFGTTGTLSGTLYVPSLIVEKNPLDFLEVKLKDFKKIIRYNQKSPNIIVNTQSLTDNSLMKENSIDYIFTDPPFGSNLMYSELNFLWETWLTVSTEARDEAIINKSVSKSILEYKALMEESFKSYYRVLKPGKWITIEFSNSQASVWNAIQETVQKSGFIIANVSALDKKQGSFKAVTTTTAVKQDLVISAYKPKENDVNEMTKLMNTVESAWKFVEQHLEKLQVFQGEKGSAEVISERTPRILFDRMIAYHVQNGLPVPVSSAEFQEEIAQRFPMRDGMVFLENQVAEYDKKRILVKDFSQQSLFVSDENSAIEWLRQQLMNKPKTRQDIHPNFMKEIQHIAKHEILPELDDLLNENFLQYEGDSDVPSQITTYLRRNFKDLRGLEADDSAVIAKAMHRWYVPDPSKQGDLERLRERALLREFDGYLAELEGNKKKLRQFRTEAIRAGFKKAYSEKEFEKIVEVGARLPEKIIQEDDKLLMFYDNASMLLDM